MKGYTPQERFTDGEEETAEGDIKEEIATPLNLDDISLSEDEEQRLTDGQEDTGPIIEAPTSEITPPTKELIPAPTTKEIIEQIKLLNSNDTDDERLSELNDLFDMIRYTSPTDKDDEIIYYLEQLNIFPPLSGREILHSIRHGKTFKQIIKRYKTKITRRLLDRQPQTINPQFKRHVHIIHNQYYPYQF